MFWTWSSSFSLTSPTFAWNDGSQAYNFKIWNKHQDSVLRFAGSRDVFTFSVSVVFLIKVAFFTFIPDSISLVVITRWSFWVICFLCKWKKRWEQTGWNRSVGIVKPHQSQVLHDFRWITPFCLFLVGPSWTMLFCLPWNLTLTDFKKRFPFNRATSSVRVTGYSRYLQSSDVFHQDDSVDGNNDDDDGDSRQRRHTDRTDHENARRQCGQRRLKYNETFPPGACLYLKFRISDENEMGNFTLLFCLNKSGKMFGDFLGLLQANQMYLQQIQKEKPKKAAFAKLLKFSCKMKANVKTRLCIVSFVRKWAYVVQENGPCTHVLKLLSIDRHQIQNLTDCGGFHCSSSQPQCLQIPNRVMETGIER